MGRWQYRNAGVPVSGAMDQFSAHWANHILGNPPNFAVLEATLVGPVVQFSEKTLIALCGAPTQAMLNGQPIAMKKPITVRNNDVLSLEKIEKGARCYLAVKNGFGTEETLGSRSFYQPITRASALKKEDQIPYPPYSTTEKAHAVVRMSDHFLFDETVPAFKGPEFDFLNKSDSQKIGKQPFHLSERNNRMAVFLRETLHSNRQQIITSPTLPGTVQLTPSGQLMLLMRDAQTTGGYPRILQLTDEGINCVAQKRTGDTIRFRLLEPPSL